MRKVPILALQLSAILKAHLCGHLIGATKTNPTVTNNLSTHPHNDAPPAVSTASLCIPPSFDVRHAHLSNAAIAVTSERALKTLPLPVYDSSAKLPSGLLNGNVNQFGDFDMCLSAAAPDFSGRYCLAAMQFEGPDSPYLSALHRLAHSHFPFRSRLEDVSWRETGTIRCQRWDCSARSQGSPVFERQLGPVRPEFLRKRRREKRGCRDDGGGSGGDGGGGARGGRRGDVPDAEAGGFAGFHRDCWVVFENCRFGIYWFLSGVCL